MIERQRASSRANAARIAVASVFIAGGALAMAGQAAADPVVPYPAPSDPAAPPVPGQPAAVSADAPPAPPPVGAPPVPEMQNPVYGQGRGSGPMGFLKDVWHQAKDPYGMAESPEGLAGSAPPPGAGAAPPLPPGYVSLNAPGSETVAAAPTGPAPVGPALPPGYYPLNGPPPPSYGTDPAAPIAQPVPPTP